MNSIEERLRAVERALEQLSIPRTGFRVYVDDVASPPTDAQLDAAIGDPATLGGRCWLLDDAGTGSAVRLVCAVNSGWWYGALTKAT